MSQKDKSSKEPKGSRRWPKPADARTPTGAAAPAYQETPLSDVFSVGGAVPVGIALAGAAAPSLATMMHDLGYTTVEEALAILQSARLQFIREVGIPASALDSFVDTLTKYAKPIPEDVRAAATAQTFGFGVLVDLAHRPPEAPDRAALLPRLVSAVQTNGPAPIGLAGGYPSNVVGASDEVNRIDEMPNPIRNQNPRSTCIPHGVLATFEHYLKQVAGNSYDLSEQFLWWACKQLDGMPQEWRGTTMTAAESALAQYGVCQEADWGYVKTDDHVNVSQGPPKDGAQQAALDFRVEVTRVAATVVREYKQVVDSGRCAAFAVDVFSSFMAANVSSTGKILMPAPGEQRIGGHCMCIVGYRDDPAPGLGGGRFILRNSFGPEWGALSPFGYPPGYGTIPYAYVAQYGREFGITFE